MPERQGAELKPVSACSDPRSVETLGFGGWGMRGGGLERRRKLSCLQEGPQGKRPTSPSLAVSRSFPHSQAAHVLCFRKSN